MQSVQRPDVAEPKSIVPVSVTKISEVWKHPATIELNNFKYKSLSNWSYNTAVGCSHGCRFCYVPSTSANKQVGPLKDLGVGDPDADWGNYVMVREWDEKKFLAKLKAAENTLRANLNRDGNRAVMFCSTTDPYQVIRNADPAKQKALQKAHEELVRIALQLTLDKSTLNVRILTRSPLAKKDFELMKKFGPRLLFGMSLPTLNDKLARIYEPNAPGPDQRLKTLQEAKTAGLHVFVAVAPTYPECDKDDLRATLTAVKDLEPVTIFHEPINIRAENVARIEAHAKSLGISLKTDVFASPAAQKKYALEQLKLVERIAAEVGVSDRLHLWPDKSLGIHKDNAKGKELSADDVWLNKWWDRVSEWPAVPVKPAVVPNLTGFSIRRPEEVLAMEFKPEDRFLENGVFAKGQPLTILGPAGLGKSRFVLQLAADSILGRDFLGMKMNAKKLKWLVLQTENSNYRLKKDLGALKQWVGEEGWPVIDQNLILHTLENSTDSLVGLKNPKVADKICDVIKHQQPDVVVFDPLVSFATGNLNSDPGMIATFSAIVETVKKGRFDASTVILHHTLTGQKGAMSAVGVDRNSYGRGSKMLHARTRGQINLSSRDSGANQRLLISCGKNSDGPDFDPIGIRLNPANMILTVDPDFNLAAWQEETGISSKPPKAFTSQDVAALLRKTPMKRSELVAKIVETEGCSKSTAYTLVTKAFGSTIEKGEGAVLRPK